MNKTKRIIEYVCGLIERIEEHRKDKELIEAFIKVTKYYDNSINNLKRHEGQISSKKLAKMYESIIEDQSFVKEMLESEIEILEINHRCNIKGTAFAFSRGNKLVKKLIIAIAP